jgi:hypothetical protein
MTNNNYSYDIIEINKDLEPYLLEKLKNLPINMLYNEERIVYNQENKIYIKFINKYEYSSILNNEIYIASEILSNKLKHLHIIDIHAIINVYENKRKRTDVNEIYGIITPEYESLDNYLKNIIDIDSNILLWNLIGILELMIYIRDTYNFVHSDIKIQNILIKNDIFYVIDWEDVRKMNENYYTRDRPKDGNTEMYPFYNVTAEEFFIYSIGVLIIRILGYNHGVSYKYFINNIPIDDILDKIPEEKIEIFEEIIINILIRKYNKIEKLKEDMNMLYINTYNG